MLSHFYKTNLLRDLSQMNRLVQFLLFTTVALFLIFTWSDEDVEIYQFNQLERIYHDKNLFTQGLEYKNGLLRIKIPLEKEEQKDIMIKVK